MITYITKGAIIPNITPDPVFAFNYNCAKFIPSKEDILLKYHLPENYVPVAFLPTGYPSDDAEPSAAHSSRKDLNETVFYNSFSQK